MSDLIFNHSQVGIAVILKRRSPPVQHNALLLTCERALSKRRPSADDETPCLLVFYTHHRPRLAHRDLEFFENARARGWTCEEILTQKFDVGDAFAQNFCPHKLHTSQVMFPEDPGDEEVRSTVHGWRLVWASAG